VRAARALEPILERTAATTLAAIVLVDRNGVVVRGDEAGGGYAHLPEVRAALEGRSRTVLRRNGEYRPRYSFEWLSRASAVRIHHARAVTLGEGQVVGALLLSRSPRALFKGIYEDRGKIALGVAVIFGALVVLAGLVSRGRDAADRGPERSHPGGDRRPRRDPGDAAHRRGGDPRPLRKLRRDGSGH
jgi:hypothetical protein